MTLDVFASRFHPRGKRLYEAQKTAPVAVRLSETPVSRAAHTPCVKVSTELQRFYDHARLQASALGRRGEFRVSERCGERILGPAYLERTARWHEWAGWNK